MRKLLNTLYVTNPQAYLSKEGETLLVKIGGELKLRLPIHTLEGIVCFGPVVFTPELMQLCAQRGVTLSFLSMYGRFWARVTGPVQGNVLLRRQQYRYADDACWAAKFSQNIVLAKIHNSRKVLERYLRDYPDGAGYERVLEASKKLKRLLEILAKELPLSAIRGKEGEAARLYFGVFNHLILAQKRDFVFHERSRRPPLDRVNALLSFVYALLLHDCISALETVGLDPAVGFLHVDRPGRPSLALDLMEEMRAYMADRFVLTLINRQQVKGKGFRKTESGGVLMDDETRKTVLMNYQKRKQEEILHPFIQEKIKLGNLPFVQAMLLARTIRGDLESYPPFFWR